jgi:hypothetical protein
LKDNAWVGKVDLGEIFSMEHLTQFVELWVSIQNVHPADNMDEDISWKLTANRQYSAKLAYEVQLFSSISSVKYKIVWNA